MRNNRFDISHGPDERPAEKRPTGKHGLGRKMIAEHSAFLSSALDENLRLRRGVLDPRIASRLYPRIPRRKAQSGGFSQMMALPGARAAIDHWWQRVLSVAESYKN